MERTHLFGIGKTKRKTLRLQEMEGESDKGENGVTAGKGLEKISWH